jgi:hypothetical protein
VDQIHVDIFNSHIRKATPLIRAHGATFERQRFEDKLRHGVVTLVSFPNHQVIRVYKILMKRSLKKWIYSTRTFASATFEAWTLYAAPSHPACP